MQCWLLAIWFTLKVSDTGETLEISTASLVSPDTTHWLWHDCDYLTWSRLCFLSRNRWHRRRSRCYNSSIVQTYLSTCSRTFSDWLPVYYSRGQTSEPLIFVISFFRFWCLDVIYLSNNSLVIINKKLSFSFVSRCSHVWCGQQTRLPGHCGFKRTWRPPLHQRIQEAHAHRSILSVWFTPPSISKTRYC